MYAALVALPPPKLPHVFMRRKDTEGPPTHRRAVSLSCASGDDPVRE